MVVEAVFIVLNAQPVNQAEKIQVLLVLLVNWLVFLDVVAAKLVEIEIAGRIENTPSIQVCIGYLIVVEIKDARVD